MKTIVALFILTLPAFAAGTHTVNTNCEAALTRAEVFAAQRKWWPDRADPKAPVLSIRTHANFAKNYLVPFGLGVVWSHEKVGELAFEERPGVCVISSNGHPADVVLSDLAKAEFPSSASVPAPASAATEKSAAETVAQSTEDSPRSGAIPVKPCKRYEASRSGPLYCAER